MLRTSLLLVTVLTATLMAVLPHHHHGTLSCFVVETCKQDAQPNDSHTAHHSEGNDEGCAVQQLHQGFLKASHTDLHPFLFKASHHHHAAFSAGACGLCELHIMAVRRIEKQPCAAILPHPFLSLRLLRAPPCAA